MRSHRVVLLGLAATIASSCALPAQAPASADEERAAVLDAVQELFDVMATRDVERARALLLPEGQFIAVVVGPDGGAVERIIPHTEFMAALARPGEAWLERFWDPEVRIHGPIAMVWTPYDFYRDGAFSHCGIDAFTLIRRRDRWVIAGVTYTVEPEGCEPSPLGPPY